MLVKTLTYTQQGLGWDRQQSVEEVNPEEYQLHELEGLPGVLFGVKVETKGKQMSFRVEGQQDHAPIHFAAAIGIPWATILVWLFKYGFPTVLQVLQILMAGGFSGLTMQQIIEWAVKAMENVIAGLPVPPIPAPGPITP